VAVMAEAKNYFVYADHLNAPRAISDELGKVVWRWDSEAFGATLANEDPDQDGKAFSYNLRFPGQYFDQSTGLHYNGFRDYDPAIGRYIQSDPIGLNGGLNTYGYVEGNPVGFVDPYGLRTAVNNFIARQAFFENVGSLLEDIQYTGEEREMQQRLNDILSNKPQFNEVCPNYGNECRPKPINGIPKVNGCYLVPRHKHQLNTQPKVKQNSSYDRLINFIFW